MALISMNEQWHPGSFTKHFGWSRLQEDGLLKLHRAINIGFDNRLDKVNRKDFASRLREFEINPLIPMNFFLYNRIVDGESILEIDELVFQAISFPHSEDFDKLALFSFNLSLAGRWKSSKPYQFRPALFSNRYIVERLAQTLDWDVSKVSTDDIESFISSDRRFRGEAPRKIATNLAGLYRLGRLDSSARSELTRWWMDAAFLAADRVCLSLYSQLPNSESIQNAVEEYDFWYLLGPKTAERLSALRRLYVLYVLVGGPRRFEISKKAIEDQIVNEQRPYGLVSRSLSRAPKVVPPGTMHLSQLSDLGFEYVGWEDLSTFDPIQFIRQSMQTAVSVLRKKEITSKFTSQELDEIFRDF